MATDRANIGRASRSSGISGVLLGLSCRTSSTPAASPSPVRPKPRIEASPWARACMPVMTRPKAAALSAAPVRFSLRFCNGLCGRVKPAIDTARTPSGMFRANSQRHSPRLSTALAMVGPAAAARETITALIPTARPSIRCG